MLCLLPDEVVKHTLSNAVDRGIRIQPQNK